MLSGASYNKIDEQGLHITVDDQAQLLAVDHIVVCAGQEPQNALYTELKQLGQAAHLIGGALLAKEIDAQKAIADGVRLAHQL